MIVFPFHSWSTHLWNSVTGLLAFIMLVLDSWAFVSCVQQSSTIPQNMRGQTAFFSLLHSLPQSPWGFACCGQFCVFITDWEVASHCSNIFKFFWVHMRACVYSCVWARVCHSVCVCGQRKTSAVGSCLLPSFETRSPCSLAAHTRPGDSPISISHPAARVGITDVHCCTQLYVRSGDPNSSPHACAAHSLPSSQHCS